MSDRALALYDVIAGRMPLQRRRAKGIYNEAALKLTARVVSAYFWFDGVPKLTAKDLKSRLQKRRR